MRILKHIILIAVIMALVLPVVSSAGEPTISKETIVKQISELFGEADIRDRDDIVSSFGSIMEDNQIIVFELTGRIILFINFKDAQKTTYMWMTEGAASEDLQNIYTTLHTYADCETISDNLRCFYMYVDDSGSNTFFLSTNDGTKFDEGEEYYPSTDELIKGVVENKHPELTEWIETLLIK